MRETLPTDLLLRLMNASPEQFATVERTLGIKAESGNQKAGSETPLPAGGQPNLGLAVLPSAEMGVKADTATANTVSMYETLDATPVSAVPYVSGPVCAQQATARQEQQPESGGSEDRGPRTEDGEDETEPSEDVARSAFALLEKLDRDAPLKAPSALTVFRLYCVQGYSAEQTARRCRCGKGTIIRRLQFIEERTGVKAARFRAMSGHVQRIDDDLTTSGAREIYRRGLMDQGEE